MFITMLITLSLPSWFFRKSALKCTLWWAQMSDYRNNFFLLDTFSLPVCSLLAYPAPRTANDKWVNEWSNEYDLALLHLMLVISHHLLHGILYPLLWDNDLFSISSQSVPEHSSLHRKLSFYNIWKFNLGIFLCCKEVCSHSIHLAAPSWAQQWWGR